MFYACVWVCTIASGWLSLSTLRTLCWKTTFGLSDCFSLHQEVVCKTQVLLFSFTSYTERMLAEFALSFDHHSFVSILLSFQRPNCFDLTSSYVKDMGSWHHPMLNIWDHDIILRERYGIMTSSYVKFMGSWHHPMLKIWDCGVWAFKAGFLFVFCCFVVVVVSVLIGWCQGEFGGWHRSSPSLSSRCCWKRWTFCRCHYPCRVYVAFRVS